MSRYKSAHLDGYTAFMDKKEEDESNDEDDITENDDDDEITDTEEITLVNINNIHVYQYILYDLST